MLRLAGRLSGKVTTLRDEGKVRVSILFADRVNADKVSRPRNLVSDRENQHQRPLLRHIIRARQILARNEESSSAFVIESVEQMAREPEKRRTFLDFTGENTHDHYCLNNSDRCGFHRFSDLASRLLGECSVASGAEA